jgi:hypothetical protein
LEALETQTLVKSILKYIYKRVLYKCIRLGSGGVVCGPQRNGCYLAKREVEAAAVVMEKSALIADIFIIFFTLKFRH